MKNTRWLALLLALIMIFATVACGNDSTPTTTTTGSQAEQTDQPAGAKTKVALLLTGTVNDAGWSESSYRGLKAAETEWNLDVAYTESLALVDMESAARDYASQGYDIIILSSTDFNDAALAVAPDFPEQRFVIINGNEAQEPNLANFRPNTPECGFIAGAFAGLITESNKVGIIGGKEFPPVVDASKGFEAGAKYTNPDVEVTINYLDSWTDIAKGTEVTISMIEQGMDVVCSNTGQAGLGTIDAAKNNDVFAIGYIDDQHSVAPGTVPFSAIQDIGDVVYSAIEFALSDDFAPVLKLVGAKQSVIRLSEFYTLGEEPVPEEVIAKMQEIYEGIVDGSLREQGILPRSGFETD